MTKAEWRSAVKYGAAFVAYMTGPGFSTGQELLQFFAAYGKQSIGVLLLSLAGFALLGGVLLVRGYEHKDEPLFRPYDYFCGKTLGKAYAVIVPVTIVMMIAVLISGAGATISQYFGIRASVGSLCMAALIFAAYMLGFERMIRLMSSISPVIIAFTLLVGIVTMLRGGTFECPELLEGQKAASSWWLSGILYLSMNYVGCGLYYTELGRCSASKKAAFWGAMFGAAAVVATIAVMTGAMLLNAEGAAATNVPTLYLAQKILPVFGAVFSVVLMLAMFVSCCTMMWSFCGAFFKEDKKKNTLLAAGTLVLCLATGMFPFDELVSVLYPIIGYIGLLFMAGVVVRAFRR